VLKKPPQEHIVFSDYDPDWVNQAKEELDKVEEALGDIVKSKEHIGATSVPGLASRPVLDVMIGVEELLPPQDYSKALAKLGFIYSAYGSEPYRQMFAKLSGRSAHIHLVKVGTEEYDKILLLRDTLRQDDELRKEYEDLKRHLADRYRNDRKAYSKGKREFITRITTEEIEPEDEEY
jgi:GrpB-like predicted nucleotidyltransferase (UPF0157 family)